MALIIAVKLEHKNASASPCMDQLQCEHVDMMWRKCEASLWPNDPKTISSHWIALQMILSKTAWKIKSLL